jgi:hypothetical protein
MTITFDTPDELATREARVKRDQYGRYLIPHPLSGETQAWQRATTFASMVESFYAIHGWEMRRAIWGHARRRDLYLLAASIDDPDDDRMNGLVNDCLAAGLRDAPANTGQAIHQILERVDREEIGVAQIEDPDIRATALGYLDILDAAGIDVMPEWIERIVLIPQFAVAGTFDRIYNSLWPLPRVGDLKTGDKIRRFGMTKIPLQLALYAHATHWYNPVTDEIGEMPAVDQDRALVVHLPQSEPGRCDLLEIKIDRGWSACSVARAVRDWRNTEPGDLYDLVTPLRARRPDTTPTLEVVAARAQDPELTSFRIEPGETEDGALLRARIAWVHQRVETIKREGYGDRLAALWSRRPHILTFPKGGPKTHDDVDEIAAMCDETEAGTDIPFPAPDPKTKDKP